MMRNSGKELFLILASIVLYVVGALVVMFFTAPYGNYVVMVVYILWWLFCFFLAKKLYSGFKIFFSSSTLAILLFLVTVFVYLKPDEFERIIFQFFVGVSGSLLLYGLFWGWLLQNWEIKPKR